MEIVSFFKRLSNSFLKVPYYKYLVDENTLSQFLSIQPVVPHAKYEEFDHKLNNTRSNLFWILKTFFTRDLLKLFLIKFISEIFRLLSPLFTYWTLYYFTHSDYNVSLVVSIFLLFTTRILYHIVSNRNFFRIWGLQEQFESLLRYSTYKKIMKLKISTNDDEIINLITTDLNAFANIIVRIMFVPLHILRFAVALFYLVYLLNFATSLVIVIIVLCFLVPLNYYCIKYSENMHEKTKKLTDKRIALVKQVINNIKMIKSFYWEEIYKKKIQSIHDNEISNINRQRLVWAIVECCWGISTFIISSGAFLFFSLTGNKLNVTLVFTVVSVIDGVRWSIFSISECVEKISKSMISERRISKFFLQHNVISNEQLTYGKLSSNVIDLKKCSFSWKHPKEVADESDIILSDIDFEVKSGEKVIVVGIVGSGKTSLLLSIMRELSLIKGDYILNENKISYYSQETWIRNGTVRDNILFKKRMDTTKYNDIIKACALDKDLDEFPLKDLSIVGEKGLMLSGGQKARIQIARALYQDDNELFLFDDCLKDLDVIVSNHIIQSLFYKNLKSKTVVLVTHNKQFLPLADKVVLMDQGRILQVAKYKDIQSNSPIFACLDKKKKEAAILDGNCIHGLFEGQTQTEENDDLINEDERTELHFSTVLKYFKPFFLRFLIAFVTAVVLYSLELYRDFFMSCWANDQDFVYHTMAYYMFNFVLIGFLVAVLLIVSQILFSNTILKTGSYLHKFLLNSVLRSTVEWLTKTSSGTILNRFSKDQQVLDQEVLWRIREFVFCMIPVVVNYGFILYICPAFTFVFVLGFITFLLQSYYYSQVFSNVQSFYRTKLSNVITFFNESLSGVVTIRAFSKEGEYIKEEFELESSLMKADKLSISTQSAMTAKTLIVAVNMTFLFCFVVMFFYKGRVDGAIVGLVITRMLSLEFTVGFVLKLLPELSNNFSSIERVIKFSSIKSENYGGKENDDLGEEGSIEFRNVSFGYDVDAYEDILKNVSFSINPGEKIGIVGRTGSGKSTLIKLLFRLYEINSGSILIDGSDIKELSLRSLRTNLSYIAQNPSLLSGTIKENLDPNLIIDDSSLWSVLERVAMKDTIKKLPKKLETTISEVKFSSGEKQLLCFARSLLQNKKLLILDEATSSCDKKTDDLIQQIIRDEFVDYTVITIAHRLETIMDYDGIIVLDKGRLIQFGTPYQLLRDSDSHLKKMVEETGKRRSKKLYRMAKKASRDPIISPLSNTPLEISGNFDPFKSLVDDQS